MQRRRYLSLAGLAVASGLAGCSDGGDRTGTTTPGTDGSGEDTDSGNGATTTRSAQHYLDRAIGTLNTVAFSLSSVQDSVSAGEEVSYSESEALDRLSSTRTALSNAEERADDAQAALIGDLRSVADALEETVQAVATLLTQRERLTRIESLVTEGDYATARDELQPVAGAVDDAKRRVQAASDHVGSVDADRLGDTDLRYGEISGAIEQLRDTLDSLGTFVDGVDSMLAGSAALERGRTAFEGGNYGTAETRFEDAEANFGAAGSTLQAERAEAPSAIVDRIDLALCQVGHLQKAAAHFAEAARAAAGGDTARASDERDAGLADLQAVETC